MTSSYNGIIFRGKKAPVYTTPRDATQWDIGAGQQSQYQVREWDWFNNNIFWLNKSFTGYLYSLFICRLNWWERQVLLLTDEMRQVLLLTDERGRYFYWLMREAGTSTDWWDEAGTSTDWWDEAGTSTDWWERQVLLLTDERGRYFYWLMRWGRYFYWLMREAGTSTDWWERQVLLLTDEMRQVLLLTDIRIDTIRYIYSTTSIYNVYAQCKPDIISY